MQKQKILLIGLLFIGLGTAAAHAATDTKYARIFSPEWRSYYMFDGDKLKHCSFGQGGDNANGNPSGNFSIAENCPDAEQENIYFDILKPVGCIDNKLDITIEGIKEGDPAAVIKKVPFTLTSSTPDHIKIPLVENGKQNTDTIKSYFLGSEGITDGKYDRLRITATCQVNVAASDGNSLIITSPQTAAPEFFAPLGWGKVNGNADLACVNNRVDGLHLEVQTAGPNLPVVVAILNPDSGEVIATSDVATSTEDGKATVGFSDLTPAPGKYRAVAFFGHEGQDISAGMVEELMQKNESLVPYNQGFEITINPCAQLEPGQNLNCQARNGNENVNVCNVQPVGNDNSRYVAGECNSNNNGLQNQNINALGDRGGAADNPFLGRQRLRGVNQVVLGGDQAFSDFNIMRIVWSTTGLYWCNALNNPQANIAETVGNLTHEFESCEGGPATIAYKDITAGMKCKTKPGDTFDANLNVNANVEFYFTAGNGGPYGGLLQIAQQNWFTAEFQGDRQSFCSQFEGVPAPTPGMLFWLNTKNAWTTQGQDLVCDGGIVIRLNQITASDPVIALYSKKNRAYSVQVENKHGLMSEAHPEAIQKDTPNTARWNIIADQHSNLLEITQNNDLVTFLLQTLESSSTLNDLKKTLGAFVSDHRYDSLFYHFVFSDESPVHKPQQGFVVSYQEVPDFLQKSLLPHFSLSDQQKKAFLDDMLPRLGQSNYYFIGMVNPAEWDNIMPLTVEPAISRTQRIMLYFEPMHEQQKVSNPDLSSYKIDLGAFDSALIEIGGIVSDPSPEAKVRSLLGK